MSGRFPMSRSEPRANDYSLAWLRIAVGVLFLIFAQYKLLGTQFIYGGGFESWIHRFFAQGAVYPFMVPVLRDLVLPHARFFAYLSSYGELGIGLAFAFGILMRPASFCGLAYMLALLFSSNYPGRHAPVWEYFGASLNHLVLALCFVAFGMSNADRVWSLSSYLRRKFASSGGSGGRSTEAYFASTNTFGK